MSKKTNMTILDKEYFFKSLDKFLKEQYDGTREEWDNEFMWNPNTKILYDMDDNKVGVVVNVENAEIEFIDDM